MTMHKDDVAKAVPEDVILGDFVSDKDAAGDLAASTSKFRQRDEASAYRFHAIARVPIGLALIALYAPYATLLAKLAATESGNAAGKLPWLGIHILPTSYVSIYTAGGAIATAIMSPPLGVIADYTKHRHNMLGIMTAFAGLAGLLSAAAVPKTWWLAGLVAMCIAIGYEISVALLNSYLADMPVNKIRSRVSRDAIIYGNIAQVILIAFLTGLVLMYSLPSIGVKGGDFKTDSDASNWFLRSGDGADLGRCTPEVCVLQKGKLATISNWILLDVPDSGIATDYGLSLRQRVELSGSNPGRNVVLESWLKPESGRGENLWSKARMSWFNGDTLVGSVDGRSRELSETQQVDRYIVVQGNIPESVTAVEMEVFLKGPGQIRVHEIKSFGSPNYIIPVTMLIAGGWFLIFGFKCYSLLHPRHPSGELPGHLNSYIVAGFFRLAKTIRNAHRFPYLIRFLVALSLYTCGTVGTTSIASLLLSEVLGLSAGMSSAILLGTQVVGIAGAIIFHKLGGRIGYSKSLAFSYFSWCLGIVLAFALLVNSSSFMWCFLVFPIIGISVGGSISQARSVFSTLIPLQQESEFFGLYLFGQLSLTWLGSLTFAVVNEYFNNLRLGVLAQVIFILPAAFIQMTIPELSR